MNLPSFSIHNMIPPCDPSILEHNPKFKRLYENLTVNILNPDGSTRAHGNDPARAATAEDLKQCQTRSSKRKIKENILKQLAFASDSGVPNEYHDNLAIISLYFETPSLAIDAESSPTGQKEETNTTDPDPNSALSLLTPEIESFYKAISSLTPQISAILSTTITNLRSISSSPDTPAPSSTLHDAPESESISTHYRSTSNHYARARARDRRVRTSMAPVQTLASQLQDRVTAIRRAQLIELPTARREMAATAAALLAVQTVVLERTVVILERAKHGALARATKANAEHLAIVAQGIEGKLEVTKLEIAAMLYTPEMLAALRRYQSHLRDSREKLEDRRVVAIEDLRGYGDGEGSEAEELDGQSGGAGGTLAEIARRYGDLIGEVEMVKMEIARIGE